MNVETEETSEGRRRLTNRDHLERLLMDGRWRAAASLAGFCGRRYGARIFELRGLGWTIEGRPDSLAPGDWEYRACCSCEHAVADHAEPLPGCARGCMLCGCVEWSPRPVSA